LEQADGILVVVHNMVTNEGRARFIPTADVAGMSDFRLNRILEELSADFPVPVVAVPVAERVAEEARLDHSQAG
jgi:hypothetical protein